MHTVVLNWKTKGKTKPPASMYAFSIHSRNLEEHGWGEDYLFICFLAAGFVCICDPW